MKKITLLLFMMVFTVAAHAQLPLEKFDTWPVGDGGWAVYQNEFGTNVTWGLSTPGSTATPAYSAPHAAYLNRGNVPTGNPEDWLVTKRFTVPANGELRFWTRLVQAGQNNTTFDVRISTNPDQSALASYVSLIDANGWTEDEMMPGQQFIYQEKVFQLNAYANQQVYIAFWMKAPSLDSDRWLVDDVSVLQKCLPPLNPTAGSATLTTANLTWGANGSTSWEVEVIEASASPTGSGIVYSGQLPYQPVLTPGTAYKYYVRSVCSGGNTSTWVGPVTFSTIPYGATCAAPRVVGPLPYSESGNTAQYGSNYNGAPGAQCGTTGNFLAGNEVVYAYTADFTGNVNIRMTNNGANSGMFVYTSCANIGVTCAAGNVGNATTPVNIPTFPVVQGTTYYIVIASSTTQTTPYTLTIQKISCPSPANTTIVPSDDSAQLTWTAAGATAWQVVVDPVGSPIPAGAGTNVTGTPTFNAQDLSAGTNYQYWVRSDCGDGTFSAWAGPYPFMTTFCAPADMCNYTFVLSDTYNGWEGGAFMTVRQNGVTVATLTLPPPAIGPVNVNVPLCHGVPFELYWDNVGTYPGEMRVSIRNPFAQTIYTKATTLTTAGSLFSGVVDCLNPLCLPLTGAAVVANSITTNTVSLRWDGPATGTWQYILLPEGSAAPADNATGWVATTTNPTTGIAIEPNSSYVAYVRLACAATNENSTWTGPIYFHSGQIPAPLEYNQDFELPTNGFARNNASQVNKWVTGTAANNGGTKGMYISNTGGETNNYSIESASVTHIYRDLQIPTGANEIGITFDWRCMGEGPANDYLRVWMVPITFNPVAGTQITTASGGQQVVASLNQNGSWTTSSFTVSSTTYAGQARRLVFEWRNTATIGQQPPAAIDNINVQVITCRVPTALALTANSVTTTSAAVTWTAPTISGMPSYDYYLSTSSTVPVESTPATQTGIVTPGTTLTTLEPSTTYYFWVRSNCGDNGTSFWVGPLVIITPQIPAPLTWNDNFEVFPAKWTLNNGTQINKWAIGNAANNGGANSLYISADNGATNTYSISSQSTVHAYRDLEIPTGAMEVDVTFDWRNGGETANDYIRVWLVPTNFNPVPGTQITAAAGRQQLGANFVNRTIWDTVTYTVDASAYAGQNRRLIFEWRNNATLGLQPPAAIDNINVKVVTCRKPQNLAAPAGTITQTAATLTWTPMNSETSWDIVVQLPELSAPTAATVGTPVPGTLPTFTATQLQPATFYVFYVRANCGGANGSSSWAGPFTFITKIANDECADSKLVPVNAGGTCLLTATGTVMGATASAEPKNCAGTSDDDVWFHFTATSPSHIISLLNIAGSNTNLNHVVYKGDNCGTMTQVVCSDPNDSRFNNYEIGVTYKIRVYTSVATPNQTTTFTICIKTPEPPLNVNGTMYTHEQLVKDVLVGSECAIVTNVTSRTGTNYGGPNGIGYFDKNNSSFPFDYGIMLSTGNINEAKGPFTGNMGGDGYAWLGDSDIEALNIANGVPVIDSDSHNASVLEFDFVPLKEDLSFDFIFASQEYGTFQCGWADAFAFILTGPLPGTTSQNLAVIPETTIPVSVLTIRDNAYNTSCASQNVQYFDKYNVNAPDSSPLGYRGQTKVMQAKATVVQGALYHIKLVIADNRDPDYNAAVFLRGGSFDLGEVQLPEDFLVANGTAICNGSQQILDSQLSPLDYEFQWLKGTELLAETGPVLVVTEPGVYTLKASYIGSTCSGSDTINVQFYPDVAGTVGNPNDLVLCNNTGFGTFNFAPNTTAILTGLNAANYVVTYFATQEDADNNVIANALPLTYANTVMGEQTIYVRVVNILTNCPPAVKSFKIKVQPDPQFTIEDNFDICIGGNGTITVVPTNYAATDPITYEWTFNGPVIAGETQSSLNITAGGVYTVKVTNGICSATKSVTVTEVPYPVVDEPASNAYCASYTLPVLTSGNYYTAANGGGTMLTAGTVITTTQQLYVYATAGSGNQCFDEHTFTVTIHPQPEVTDIADVQACNTYALPAITVGNYFTGPAGTGTMLNAGDAITTDQTIYIYAQSGTTPNCTDEESFTVTILTAPIITDPADVAQCSPYTLPVLTLGNYFTGPNGTGTQLSAGDVISTTQTIYVFAPGLTAVCDSQQDFLVEIHPQPEVTDIADVMACNSYTLPAITVGNYFTGPAGTGTMLNAGDAITTDQTIYIYAQSGTTPNCTDEESFTVTLTTAPVMIDPADVAQCSPYMLPVITFGNYFTGPNGTGTQLSAGDVITTTQTIYVFAPGMTAVCDAQQDFLVEIHPQPNVTDPSDVVICGSYTLPALTVGNYFTGPAGTGTMLNAGDVITVDQTIYVYAQSGTTPNCTDEESFTVTITPNIAADDLADEVACESFQLQALSPGNSYYTGPGKTGTMLAAGTVIDESQTIYVYAEQGTCNDEDSFAITIVPKPRPVTIDGGCDGGQFVLNAVFDPSDANYTADNVSFAWSRSVGGAVIATTQSIVAAQSGEYYLTVSPNGSSVSCSVTANFDVTDNTCMIQRGISPNNDGLNDNFDLTALSVTKLSIYNRYGQEVFSYGVYTNQWHGQNKGGDELPTGTYFYSFERANGEKATGWIYINREQ